MLRPPLLRSLKKEPARYLKYLEVDIISPVAKTVVRDYAIYNHTKNKTDQLLQYEFKPLLEDQVCVF